MRVGDTDKNTETLIAEWESTNMRDRQAMFRAGQNLVAALTSAQEVVREYEVANKALRERCERSEMWLASRIDEAVAASQERERTLREALEEIAKPDEAKNSPYSPAVFMRIARAALVASSGGQTQKDLGVAQSAPSVATEDGNA